MNIQLKYFAQLADHFGTSDEEIQLDCASMTVLELKAKLSERGTNWSKALADTNTRCAVNQSLASDATDIPNNAEVAFFPPVTGG